MRFPLPLLALVAGCTLMDRGDGSRTSTSRTTRGDTTVIATRTTGAIPAHTLAEELRIGSGDVERPDGFARISEIAVDPSGRIAVFDVGRRTLVRFDSTGASLGQIGREGDGPGEYRDGASGWLAALGDGSLALWGGSTNRITLFDAGGAFVRTWGVEEGVGLPTTLGAGADGTVRVRRPTLDGLGGIRVLDWTTAGLLVRTDTVPRFGADQELSDASQRMRERLPFGARNVAATFPGGWVAGHSGEYVLHWSRDGVRRRIERTLDDVEVAPGERTYWEREMVAFFRQLDPAWQWGSLTMPSVKAPFDAILAGDDGSFLVRVAVPGIERPNPEAAEPLRPGEPPRTPTYWSEPSTWERFDTAGTFTGRIALPDGVRPRALRGDRLWAIVRDSMDVPSVVRYRIGK